MLHYYTISCAKSRCIVRADSPDRAQQAFREEYGRSAGDLEIERVRTTLDEASLGELSWMGYLDAESGRWCRDEAGRFLVPTDWQMMLPERLGGINLKAKGTEMLETYLYKQGKSDEEIAALLRHYGLPVDADRTVQSEGMQWTSR